MPRRATGDGRRPKTFTVAVVLNRGEGRAVRPTLTARKVHIEIDLALEN